MSTTTCIPLSEAEIERLKAIIKPGAARVKTYPEHWINGSDESLSYCHACAEMEVSRLRKEEPDGEYRVAGGYGTEGDSTPFCENCGKRLENTLTDYGCEEEVSHFLRYGFTPLCDDDCYSLDQCVMSRGWVCHENPDFDRHLRQYEIEDRREYFADFTRLCRMILALPEPTQRQLVKRDQAWRNIRRAGYRTSCQRRRQSYWWNEFVRWTPSTKGKDAFRLPQHPVQSLGS